jgi:hypothetical protein
MKTTQLLTGEAQVFGTTVTTLLVELLALHMLLNSVQTLPTVDS